MSGNETGGKVINFKKSGASVKNATPSSCLAEEKSPKEKHSPNAKRSVIEDVNKSRAIAFKQPKQETQRAEPRELEKKPNSKKFSKLSAKKRAILAICGGLPLLLTFIGSGHDNGNDSGFVIPRKSDYSLDGVSETEIQQIGIWNPGELYYPRPKISLLDRLFCRGRKVSESCSKEPLHPHNESFKAFGMKVPNHELHKYTATIK